MTREEKYKMLKRLAHGIGDDVGKASENELHGEQAERMAITAIADTLFDGDAHNYFGSAMGSSVSEVAKFMLFDSEEE